ncbi:hypothetical protein EXIGLDRAFT_804957 [Exidia glandulosa HHB12029]|uniref:Uncharacterized protein n=1 Tax=Exidia glandulosa HHB12029 TaxID=1314781 RepID=A0A165DR52_EXIGL|nr:hypothetical protein EXIGLDRAFT_804957 [Exidia glandulosa HHB12029]
MLVKESPENANFQPQLALSSYMLEAAGGARMQREGELRGCNSTLRELRMGVPSLILCNAASCLISLQTQQPQLATTHFKLHWVRSCNMIDIQHRVDSATTRTNRKVAGSSLLPASPSNPSLVAVHGVPNNYQSQGVWLGEGEAGSVDVEHAAGRYTQPITRAASSAPATPVLQPRITAKLSSSMRPKPEPTPSMAIPAPGAKPTINRVRTGSVYSLSSVTQSHGGHQLRPQSLLATEWSLAVHRPLAADLGAFAPSTSTSSMTSASTSSPISLKLGPVIRAKVTVREASPARLTLPLSDDSASDIDEEDEDNKASTKSGASRLDPALEAKTNRRAVLATVDNTARVPATYLLNISGYHDHLPTTPDYTSFRRLPVSVVARADVPRASSSPRLLTGRFLIAAAPRTVCWSCDGG